MKRLTKLSALDMSKLENDYRKMIEDYRKVQLKPKPKNYELVDHSSEDNNTTFVISPPLLVNYENYQQDTPPYPSIPGPWMGSERWIRSSKRLTNPKKLTAISRFGKPYISLCGFLDKGGIHYELTARILGKDLYYSVVSNSGYDSFSLYDGLNFDSAFELFCELALALKGLSYAESYTSMLNSLKKRIFKELIVPSQDLTLKKKYLWMGDGDAL